MATHQTAPTQYISSPTTKYAYRRLGQSTGTPLLLLIHFRGNMDKWDPLLVNSLAKHRPLILVDYPGIGKSTGRVAPTFRESAENIIEFLRLLKITEVDILGFSIGAFVAQMVALNRDPKVLKVRHLIIAGSSASVGPDMPATTNDYVTHATAGKLEVEHFKRLFFPKNAEGDAAAEAYWERLKERNVKTSGEEPADWASQDLVDGGAAMQTQGQAYAAFLTAETSQGVEGSYGRLHELDMPVLVAQGSDDFMFPTINSFVFQQKVKKGTLLVFPNSGHGFLYQYAEAVAEHVALFLRD